MASKRLTKYIIIFNVLMTIFLFFFSQFVLIILNGTIVKGVGIYLDYGFPSSSGGPIPTSHTPLINYPLFVFIFTLIVNAILIFQLRRENKRVVLQN